MEERVLVWAVGRDGPLTCQILAGGNFGSRNCPTREEFCREIGVGAGAALSIARSL